MVDEFSSFARMPAPVMRREDIGRLVEQAVFLQRTAQPQVQFGYTPPPQPLVVPCDGRQVSQALTNLIKNAIESIEGRQQAQGEDAPGGAIDVTLGIGAGNCVIEVADNGRGLPDVNRRSEEHTSELQSLMRISYAVFCLKKKKHKTNKQ